MTMLWKFISIFFREYINSLNSLGSMDTSNHRQQQTEEGQNPPRPGNFNYGNEPDVEEFLTDLDRCESGEVSPYLQRSHSVRSFLDLLDKCEKGEAPEWRRVSSSCWIRAPQFPVGSFELRSE